eukprot:gene4207-5269_t
MQQQPNIGNKVKDAKKVERPNNNNNDIEEDSFFHGDNSSVPSVPLKEFRPLDIPLKEYTPKGYHLKFMQIITRHGRRTPESKRYPLHMWSCNSSEHLISNQDPGKVTCDMGQLTVCGTNDMIEVGKAYKSLLIDHLHFLDPSYNPSQIFIRSSNRTRTISSARSFIHGLFGGSFNEEEKTSGISSNFFIMTDKTENIYPRSCDKYLFLKGIVKKHRDVLKRNKEVKLKEFTEKVQEIFEEGKGYDNPFYIPSWRSFTGLVNTFDAFKNHNLPIPPGFTKEIIDRMYLESAQEYKNLSLIPELSILGMGRFIGDLTKQMTFKAIDRPEAKDIKLALFSAHDTTIGGLLSAYKMYEDNRHPVTSSSLEFLLFESDDKKKKKSSSGTTDDQYVKVIYNQKVVHIQDCQSKEVDNMCPLSEFLDISRKMIPSNWEEQCKISDDEKKRYIIAIK